MEKWYREYVKNAAIEEAEAIIEDQLGNQIEHDRLVGKIARLFIDGGDAFDRTDFQFITFDPICELGHKNADILLFNTKQKTAILIEVKTGDKSSPISDLNDSRKAIESNIKYLQNFLNT